jgi:uncharacterized protein YhbP (UPF0306 family)
MTTIYEIHSPSCKLGVIEASLPIRRSSWQDLLAEQHNKGSIATTCTIGVHLGASILPENRANPAKSDADRRIIALDALDKSAGLVRHLFASEQLAVLSTHYGGQPYSNLVAFAYTDDLKHLIFVTSRNTRKYDNVSADKRVAVLVDSRRRDTSDFQGVAAITALGTAQEATGGEREELLRVYLAKHPHLEAFANNKSSALIKISISDYIIARFDSVSSLHIDD